MAHHGHQTRNIQFTTLRTRPECESLVFQYFQLQKFYRVESEDSLMFRGYGERKHFLSPAGLHGPIEVSLAETPNGCLINCTIYIYGRLPTSIEDDYYKAFLEHFKQALLNGEITLFPAEKYEEESRRYSRAYLLTILATGAIFLAVAILLKTGVIFMFAIFIAPLFGTMAVNWLRDQKRLENKVE